MNVLLVNPSCLDKRVTDNDAMVLPIGLYYLAAQLLDRGISTRILNLAQFPDGQTETFISEIKRNPPDIIGFSVTNPSRFSAMECAQKAKALFPNLITIFGGPAPTFMAPHLFKACPELDIVIKGEGERTLDALVEALNQEETPLEIGSSAYTRALGRIKGLVFREGQTLADTGQAEPVQDLDSLARPSRFFTYQHLAMSRGCPGKCTFCGSPKFWGASRVRRHSPEWFFYEIKALVQKGVTHFFISDDTFTMDKDAVLRFCDLIIDANLLITWNAISRVDYIDRDLLHAMRRAGCIQISFGVESGSKEIRKYLGKPMDDQTCIKAFTLTRSYGIMPRAYFIYGSPNESDKTIDQSIALMEKLGPLSAVFYMLVLFPGTHLYTRARQKKQVSDEIWFEKIEDLPWFELDPALDFPRVKAFGDKLRNAFFKGLKDFVADIHLVEDKSLDSFHSDFLSRLAMTFSQGEYARDPRIDDPAAIARDLFQKALIYGHDPRAVLGLAMILQKERDLSGAERLLAQGLDRHPGHKDLSICMGVCLMNQGEFSRALDFFKPFDKDPGLGQYIEICNARQRG